MSHHGLAGALKRGSVSLIHISSVKRMFDGAMPPCATCQWISVGDAQTALSKPTTDLRLVVQPVHHVKQLEEQEAPKKPNNVIAIAIAYAVAVARSWVGAGARGGVPE